jgi:hypothetical protein
MTREKEVALLKQQDNTMTLTHLSRLVHLGYETSLGLWILIFSFVISSKHDYHLRIQLRRQCKLFKDALKPVVSGIYTTFPHPRHETLKDLIDSLNTLTEQKNIAELPKYIFITKGLYHVNFYTDDDGDKNNSCLITFPISIIGEGMNDTILQAGFDIVGNKKDQVSFKDITIRNAAFSGICGHKDGPKIVCDACKIEKSGACGVVIHNCKGSLTNCQIHDNGLHGIGVLCSGTAELKGEATKVTSNCTNGEENRHYGLYSCCSTSKIEFIYPLTKEKVSTKNGGGGNWGGDGAWITTLSY